jgi:tetratricopeptide (TPR) repeat protein
MRALSTFVLVVLLAGALAPAWGQDWLGRGRAQGRVLDPEGNPVEEAQITLRIGDAEGSGPDVILTDKKGRWSFLGLEGGTWTVRIEKKGYLVSEGEFPISEFGVNPPIVVKLKNIPEEVIREAMGAKIQEALDRGNALMAEGKPAEARAAYEEILADLEPQQQPAVIMGIARAYYQEDDLPQTEASLQRALAIDPDNVDALKLLSSLLMTAGREEEAKVYMDRLPEGEALHADAYLNLGIDSYNEGDLEAALVEFEKVIASFPDNASGYYYRGLVFLAQGDTERSADDFEKLLELEPDGDRADEAREFLEHLRSAG